MQNRLFIAEKPSVGKVIAEALGSPRRCSTHFETSGGIVTWAIGHLLELDAPGDYKPEWKQRGFASLPIVPEEFHWSAVKETSSQLRAVGGLIKALGRGGEVVISTDAGPEGELIGREILDHFRYRGTVLRLWTGATDPESLRKALASLRPGQSTVPLYDAARARSCADWLVGMNLSRALTAACLPPGSKSNYAVGRVVSPTLALVVRRDRAIRNFVARDYFEVMADVRTLQGSHQVSLRYAPTEEKRLWEQGQAAQIAAAAKGTKGSLQVAQSMVKKAPPSPLSLGDLQKAANRRLKWSAKKTLQIAQALYEKHKAITYPRSDCSFLPDEQWPDVPKLLEHLRRPGILPAWPPGNWEPLRRKSVWNTAKIGDHHAIIPTGLPAPWDQMDADERSCYQMVAQYYVGCLLADAEALQTVISLPAAGVIFEARGSVPKVMGWRVVFPAVKSEEVEFPPVEDGMEASVEDAKVEGKKTKPPAAYTEASLLTDMEDVAKYVADPRLQKVLRSEIVAGTDAARTRGIGTVATRADTIEKLKRTKCIEAVGSKLVSLVHGQQLIGELEKRLPEYADPGLTALWEIDQEEIVAGKQTFEGFITKAAAACTGAVDKLRAAAPPEALAQGQPSDEGTMCPKSGRPVLDMGDHYNFPGYPTIRCWKTIAKRTCSAADFAQAFAAAPNPGPFLDGFESGKGKAFKAALHYAPNPETGKNFQFVFPDTEGAEGQRLDFYTLAEAPGVRCWHTFLQRPMSEEDYRRIIGAGKQGCRLDGFKSKGGNSFGATVVFDAKAKPHPKFNLEFDSERAGAGPQSPGPASRTQATPGRGAASGRR